MVETPLDQISEAALLDAVGQARVDQAASNLARGYVTDRNLYPYGRFDAFWEPNSRSEAMAVYLHQDQVMMTCTCREFARQRGFGCQHLDGLLLAWVRERDSFELVDEFEEDDDLLSALIQGMDEEDDDDDEYDDEEDLFEAQFGYKPPVPPLSRQTTPKRQEIDPVADYKTFLSALTVTEIRDIARRRGVAVSGLRKDPIVETLAQALAQPGKLAEDWPKLSESARRLLGVLPFLTMASVHPSMMPTIISGSGLKNEQAVLESFGELREFGLVLIDNYNRIIYPKALPAWLPPDNLMAPAYKGDLGKLRVQKAAAPRDLIKKVVRLLLLLQSKENRVLARPAKLKNTAYIGTWPVFADDLRQIMQEKNFMQAIRKHNARVAPDVSPLAEASRDQLAQVMKEPPELIDWLIHLLVDLNLVRLEADKPVQVDQGALATLLQSDPLQLATRLLNASVEMTGWTEFDLIFAQRNLLRLVLIDQPYNAYSHFLGTTSSFRAALMFQIRRQPAGEWVDTAEFANLMHRSPLSKLLEAFTGFGRWEADGKRLALNQGDDWKRLFGYFLQALLMGPLSWNGMVDLAWNQNKLVAYRLTDLGAALLGQNSSYHLPAQEQTGPSLSFGPDGELLLRLDAASGELISLLTLIGEPGMNAAGDVVYRPTMEGVGRAFESGWTLDRIQHTLQEAAGQQPVPASLAVSLARWWENYGSLQIYGNVALIEFNDDFALNELLAGTALARYMLYRFSSRMVAIRPEGVEALRAEMVKKGYTPKIEA